jgi:hypothetical protein
MSTRERWLIGAGLAVLAGVLAWAWQAYFTPAMMVDLANLRLCL